MKLHNVDTTVCAVDVCFKLHKVVEITIKVSKVVVNPHNLRMDQFFCRGAHKLRLCKAV